MLQSILDWMKSLDDRDKELAQRFGYPARAQGPRVPDAFYREPVEPPEGDPEFIEWDPDAHEDADDFNPAEVPYIAYFRESDWGWWGDD